MAEEYIYEPEKDQAFAKPYIDQDEWRDTPVRHRFVHGGFEGTDCKFAYYFPEKDNYRNRFFHYVAPVQGTEIVREAPDKENDTITFALSHGAYLVSSNMGGPSADGVTLLRSNAAVAAYSRKVAADVYGLHRPFGYVCGGSGGSLKTCACIEGTKGIWDGAVPFVIGNPMAIPNPFTARTHAMRILRHKLPQIVDALEPGGSGEMYAGLNAEEKEALEEVTRMGFPPRTWFAHDFIGDGSLGLLTPLVVAMAPNYYKDFWEKPGYLGADPEGSARRDRILLTTKIQANHVPETIPREKQIRTGVDEAWHIFDQLDRFTALPTMELEEAPEGEDLYLQGAKLIFLDGEAAGQSLPVAKLEGKTVTIGETFQPGLHKLLSLIKVGDSVMLDNSDYIAIQTFHRHQNPKGDFAGWRQFQDEKGNSLYPQEPLVGPMIALGGSGKVQTGHFDGKMIVLSSLMDESAFPWFADWYKKQVEEYFGDQADDHFRLWYMDHAMHAETAGRQAKLHVVDYMGALNQAMLDLADWVEKGITPPTSTNYVEKDAQIMVPADADERAGVQPVVELNTDMGKVINVHAGEPVKLTGIISVPNKTGKVLSAQWDFEETGTFETPAQLAYEDEEKDKAWTEVTHMFRKKGVYFPVLRAVSARNENDIYIRIKNLDRVRVVVE